MVNANGPLPSHCQIVFDDYEFPNCRLAIFAIASKTLPSSSVRLCVSRALVRRYIFLSSIVTRPSLLSLPTKSYLCGKSSLNKRALLADANLPEFFQLEIIAIKNNDMDEFIETLSMSGNKIIEKFVACVLPARFEPNVMRCSARR